MSRELEQLLRRTAAAPSRALDVRSIASRARRRRRRNMAGYGAVLGVGAVAIGAVAIGAVSLGQAHRSQPVQEVPLPLVSGSISSPAGAARPALDLRWERIDSAFKQPNRNASGPRRFAVVGDRVVAVGSADNTSSPHPRPGVWISTDGRTWRAIAPERIELGDASKTQSMSDTAVWMSDLVTLPSGRLVAVGALNFEPGGAPAVWLSDDAGESWRRTPGPVTTESESAGMESVTLTAAGKIVAVGGRDPSDLSRSPMAWTSTDGSVWASVELPGLDRVSAPAQPPSGQQPLPRAAWVSSVAANGDVVVAVGGDSDNRPLLLSSRDLLTWQLVEPRPALRGSLSAVVATGAGFLAVGASEAGDGLAYEVDASGSSVRDASGGGSFAGPGSQALWGAAVARDDSWIVVGEDDGRAAVWTRGGGQWVKAAGDEALWPRGSIGTVSVSPYGLVALGRPAGKNADLEQILWLGTPP